MSSQSPMHEVYVEEILHFWEPKLPFGTPLAVLRQKGGDGRIMVLTDPFRTKEIIMALEGQKHERPLTLDFAKRAIENLGGEIQYACISNSPIKEMNYFGTVMTRRDGQDVPIDCRPSDAIAIALKEKATLYVREECFGTLNNPLCGYAPISHIWPFRTKGYEWVRAAAVRREKERAAEKAAAPAEPALAAAD
jgi:uncharacterized protein